MTYTIDHIKEGKKVYLISDFHLGTPNYEQSLIREKKIIRFLDHIKKDAGTIFLIGDIFDFWFEYKYVIPKGYVRILGKLAELSDSGIELIYFTGNHDMWTFGYLEKELNMKLFRKPQHFTINNKTFLIGHGDGLGPGDLFYKFLKKIFANSFFQWLFKVSPPVIGMGIAHYWSKHSRINNKDEKFYGEEEWLFVYCKEIEAKKHHDYYIFGHRHLPLNMKINDHSKYINTGEWVNYFSYAEFDGKELTLKTFEDNK